MCICQIGMWAGSWQSFGSKNASMAYWICSRHRTAWYLHEGGVEQRLLHLFLSSKTSSHAELTATVGFTLCCNQVLVVLHDATLSLSCLLFSGLTPAGPLPMPWIPSQSHGGDFPDFALSRSQCSAAASYMAVLYRSGFGTPLILALSD